MASGLPYRGDLEVLGLGSLHHHRHAANHADELNVADPVRSRQDDLVAGVHPGAESHIDAGLAPLETETSAGAVLHTAVLLQTLADGLAQSHSTHRRRILGVVILDGLDTNLLNVVGGGEIRLTGAEADDVQASAFICLNMVSMAMVAEGSIASAIRDNSFIENASVSLYLQGFFHNNAIFAFCCMESCKTEKAAILGRCSKTLHFIPLSQQKTLYASAFKNASPFL